MLLYQLAITQIPGIGDVNAKKLISYCGSVEAVFNEKRKNLMKIPGMGPATVNAILGQQVLQDAEREMRFMEKYHIQALYYLDDPYPRRLKHCLDAPILVFYKGNADLNMKYVVGVVGTRKISSYGREQTGKLIQGLAKLDVLVVSGLAYGVDTVAHRTALSAGLPTLGILAHGLDRIYPGVNRKLAIQMQESGGLLTEFWSNTNPDRENFPRRNRIVAGLTDAIVVIESARKGGALITANIATSYNRDVFALPGRVGDTYSEGCHHLIKTNKAALIESAEDLLYFMQWSDEKAGSRQSKMFRELNPEEEKILEVLREHGECSVDFLVMNTRLSYGKIAEVLLNLEFDGLVINLPGKMYRMG